MRFDEGSFTVSQVHSHHDHMSRDCERRGGGHDALLPLNNIYVCSESHNSSPSFVPAAQALWGWPGRPEAVMPWPRCPSSSRQPFHDGSSSHPCLRQGPTLLGLEFESSSCATPKAKSWPHKSPGHSTRALLSVCTQTCLCCLALQRLPRHTGSLW